MQANAHPSNRDEKSDAGSNGQQLPCTSARPTTKRRQECHEYEQTFSIHLPA
jgi:hypothetical protein